MRERHRSKTVHEPYGWDPARSLGGGFIVTDLECSSKVLGLCSAGSGVLTRISGQKDLITLSTRVNVGKRKI